MSALLIGIAFGWFLERAGLGNASPDGSQLPLARKDYRENVLLAALPGEPGALHRGGDRHREVDDLGGGPRLHRQCAGCQLHAALGLQGGHRHCGLRDRHVEGPDDQCRDAHQVGSLRVGQRRGQQPP